MDRMNDRPTPSPFLQREILLSALYEAAELEHNLMCTYLYAAASLRDGAYLLTLSSTDLAACSVFFTSRRARTTNG